MSQHGGQPLHGLCLPHSHGAGHTAALEVVEGLRHGQEAALSDRGQGHPGVCSVELVAIEIGRV